MKINAKSLNNEIKMRKEKTEAPVPMAEERAFDYATTALEGMILGAIAYLIFQSTFIDNILGSYIPEYFKPSSAPQAMISEEEFLERIPRQVSSRVPGQRAAIIKFIIFILVFVAIKYYRH